MANKNKLRGFVIYLSLAIVIMLIVYYVPNYYFLESAIATHSSTILGLVGMSAPVRFADGVAYVGNYAVIRDCTGVQVLAVFLGIILPLPGSFWRKKLVSLAVLGGLLYGANLFRVILEYYLVEANILPWSLAHYPMSLVLGVFGVFFLVLINNRVLPEFGEYLFSVLGVFKDLGRHRRVEG
jgi:exosortase/archaeosortase family protein